MLLRSIQSRLWALVLATVVPFAALIGVGLWSQWQNDQTAALERALSEARVLAAQVDDHIGNLEYLLTGLSRAVSTNPEYSSANDALLRQVRSNLPAYIGNILLFALDGSNIGTSADPEIRLPNIGDRAFFRQVLAGQRLAVGEVIRGHLNGPWILTIASPVEDDEGRLRAVLAIGTQLVRFQDILRIHGLPAESVVRIVNEHRIVVAHSSNGPNWIGRDLGGSDHVARHLAAKEASEKTPWSDGVERITGSSTSHRVPWLVSVGLPTNIAFAQVASRLGWGSVFGITTLFMALVIAWMFSGRIVGPLRQLEKDSLVLAAGDLSHRSTVNTRDEVGSLAGTFNRMAVALQRRQDEVLQSKDTLSAIIDASPVAIACSGLDRNIVLWSRAAEQLYGYTAEEAIGFPVKTVPTEGHAESLVLYRRARSGEIIRDVQVKRKRKDGSLVDVKIAAAPMFSADGTVRGVAWAHEDITNYKLAEEQLKRLAHNDPLTGLPNRLSLQKELGRLLTGGDYHTPTSIALFDLDGFKDVNDTLGHSIGDELLIEVGYRLIEVTENRIETGQVFRLGGDEFVVIVPNCGDPRVVIAHVDVMLKRLAEPFKINDQSLHVGGSAGIAIAPHDGSNVDELIANADLALYQAKSDGGRTCRLFLPVLRAQAQARRRTDLDLRRAYAENEFEIYFQPQIRLADNAVVGAEALLRWRHPERGILAPGVFIETLAESSIAPDVGRWIIRTACEQTAAWRATGINLNRIGVNLFPTQLQGDYLADDTNDALRRAGLPADILELEITENVALNYNDAIKSLQSLHDRGVKLAFDDFGTGYASLSSLTRFPLSRIKIDRSFVGKIADNADDAAIVRSLIAMAHNLRLEVIAEGVETEAQAKFLLDQQCEEAQGFLYAKPLPAAEFEEFFRTWQSSSPHQIKTSVRQRITRRSHRQPPSARSPGRRRFP